MMRVVGLQTMGRRTIFIVVLLSTLCNALQPNLAYYYRYSSRISFGIPELRDQHSGLLLNCDVAVEVDQSHEHMTVQVSGIGYHIFTDKKQNCPDEEQMNYSNSLLDALTIPFVVYLHNSDIKLKVPQDGPLYIDNIRKSIVSLLDTPVVTDPMVYMTPSFKLFEHSIHGYCESRYNLQPLPDFDAHLLDLHIENDVQEKAEKSGAYKSNKKKTGGRSNKKKSGGRKSSKSSKSSGKLLDGSVPELNPSLWRLNKVINFDHCETKISLQDITVGLEEPIGTGQVDNVASRSSLSQYILRGDHKHGFRVETVFQEGSLTHNPVGFTTEKIVAMTNQSLTLVSVTKNDNDLNIDTSSYRSVNTYYYEVKSPFPAPDGPKKDYIKYMGEDPTIASVYPDKILLGMEQPPSKVAELKEDIIIILKTVASILGDEPTVSDHLRPDAMKLMSKASHDVFYLTRPMMSDLFDQIYTSKDKQNDLMQQLVVDLIASSGSQPSVSVILEKYREGKISELRLVSIFMTLANSLYDVSVVPELMEFAMNLDLDKSPLSNSNILVNTAIIMRKLCLDPRITKKVGGPIFAVQNCNPEKILDVFIPYLQKCIKETSHEASWKIAVYTQALVNLHTPHTIKILEEVFFAPDFPISITLTALRGFNSLNQPPSVRDKALDFLFQVFYNVSEPIVLRQEAMIGILSYKPCSATWHSFASMTYNDPSKNMRAFIYSMIESVANYNTFGNCERQKKIALHVLPLAKPHPNFPYFPTGLYVEDWSADIGLSIKGLMSNMKSLEGMEMESHLSRLLKIDYGGVKFLEFMAELTLEGLNNFHKKNKKVSFDPKDIASRIANKFYENIMNNVYEGYQNSRRRRSKAKFNTHIVLNIHENEQLILPLTKDSIAKDNNLDATTLFIELAAGKESIFTKYKKPVFIAYAVPSDIGLPFVTQHTSRILVYKNSYSFVSSKFDFSELSASSELDLRMFSDKQTDVSTFIPFESKAVLSSVTESVSFAIPVVLEASFDQTNPLSPTGSFEIKGFYPRKQFTVANYRVEPVTAQVNYPMTLANMKDSQFRPIITEPDVKEDGVLQNMLNYYHKISGIQFKIKESHDVAKSYLVETVAYHNVEILYTPEQSENEDASVKILLKIVKPSKKSDNLQEDPYSQYSQFDQVSNSDYGNQDTLDSYDYDTASENLQQSQKPSNPLDRLTQDANGYSELEVIFGDLDDKGFVAVFSKSFKMGTTMVESDYNIILNLNRLHQKFCVDVKRSRSIISRLDTLQELAEKEVHGFLYVSAGFCGEKSFEIQGSATATHERVQNLLEELIADCHIDSINLFSQFKWKLSYNEAKLKFKFGSYKGNIEATSMKPYKWWHLKSDKGILFDYTPDIPNVPIQTFSLKEYSTNEKCIISDKKIINYDGLVIDNYVFSSCWTVVTRDCSNPLGYVVLVSTDEGNRPYKARIISPVDGVVADISHELVEINGKEINPIGERETVYSKTGKKIAIVRVHGSNMEVIIPKKVRVSSINDVIEVAPYGSNPIDLCGVCGDQDGEIGYSDFVGPQECMYTDFDLLAAAYSTDSDSCDEYSLMEKKSPVHDFQKSCQKVPDYIYAPANQQDGLDYFVNQCRTCNTSYVYPVETHVGKHGEKYLCLSSDPIPVNSVTMMYFKRCPEHLREFKCYPYEEAPDILKNANRFLDHPVMLYSYKVHQHATHY